MNARILSAMSIACLSAFSLNAFVFENQLDKPITLQNYKSNPEAKPGMNVPLWLLYDIVTIEPDEKKNIELKDNWSWNLMFEYNNKHYYLDIKLPSMPRYYDPMGTPGRDKLRLMRAKWSEDDGRYIADIAPLSPYKLSGVKTDSGYIQNIKNLNKPTGVIIQKNDQTGEPQIKAITQ